MGDTKTLLNAEAIEKIKELADGKICLFCTNEDGIVTRPMSTQAVDDDGTMWFFSKIDSEKNQQINQDNKVYLMYMNDMKQHYLSLSGYAEIVVDKQKVEELWNPMVKAWYEEGKDDPTISLIRVTPEDGYYWDTKHGSLITLFKIALAAVTGKRKDDEGIEGELKL